MRGRWGRSGGEVVTMQQGKSTPLTLIPARIQARPYMEGIRWGWLGTPEEAVAKAEVSRMLQIYERFGGVQQPLKYRDGHVVWEVRFPANSRWANGPEQSSAWLAMLENYVKNGRFRGYMDGTAAEKTSDNLRSLDKIVSDSYRQDQTHLRGLHEEGAKRAQHTQGAQ